MIRFRALGGVDLVTPDGSGASILRRPKHLGLLAYLTLARPRGFHRRDSLLAIFWPELVESRARGALRQSLTHLRQGLSPGVIVTRGDEEVGIDSSRFSCDVIDFESNLDADRLEAAVDLYRGELLSGFHLSGSPEMERWLDGERDRLRRRAVGAASTLVRRAEERGDLAGAIGWGRRILELSPYDEPAARALVGTLDRVGARAEAIETYDTFVRRLRRDVDIAPSAETRAVGRAIRATEPSAGSAPDPPPPGTARREEPDVARVASEPVARTDRRSRRRVLWAATVALAAVLVAVPARWGWGIGGEDDGSVTRVAVFPFTVSGSAELTYLREGLAELLSTDLDGAGELRSVDLAAVLSGLASDDTTPIDPSRGRTLAKRLGAGLYVLGAMVEADGQLRARASLHDSGGRHLGTADAVVDHERRLFDLVDELARELVAIAPGQKPERLTRLAAMTTGSFPALKGYLEGEGWHRRGRYDSAATAYQRSIAADSAFALAYYRMAVARRMDPTPSGLPDARQRAFALRDRLPPRDRLLVEAFDAMERHQDREADQLYKEVLSRYPDEVEAWVFLGESVMMYGLWRGRPIADARSAFEGALALDSSHLRALDNLSVIAAMEERFDEVRTLTQRMLTLHPDGDFSVRARLRLALGRGDRMGEEAVLDELRGVESEKVNWAQRWAHSSGNLEGRQRTALLLTDPSRPDRFRVLGHTVSARYEVDRGRWRAAFDEVRRIEAIDRDEALRVSTRLRLRPYAPPVTRADLERMAVSLDRWTPKRDRVRTRGAADPELTRLYLRGLVAVQLRDSVGMNRAMAALDERAAVAPAADDSVGSTPAMARDLSLGVRAWWAAERGRNAESLGYLEQLQPERWWKTPMGGIAVDAVQPWLRAEMLIKAGRDREALDVLAPLGWMSGDAGLLAPKHLRMGEVYERLGDRKQAAWHYRRVLEIWKECDPELSDEVRSVEARLTGLR